MREGVLVVRIVIAHDSIDGSRVDLSLQEVIENSLRVHGVRPIQHERPRFVGLLNDSPGQLLLTIMRDQVSGVECEVEAILLRARQYWDRLESC